MPPIHNHLIVLCVERVMEAQEFAQAMMYHLQFLDTFHVNVKQGALTEMRPTDPEHWARIIADGNLLQR